MESGEGSRAEVSSHQEEGAKILSLKFILAGP